ncbi:hypothetical protein BKA60DRAFT_578095 [Fusarium oxysporum]|nr:hypothetical protein BKA60DRAFT_578095 [Fusarium oxysporum]
MRFGWSQTVLTIISCWQVNASDRFLSRTLSSFRRANHSYTSTIKRKAEWTTYLARSHPRCLPWTPRNGRSLGISMVSREYRRICNLRFRLSGNHY